MKNIVWRLILASSAGLVVSGLCFNLVSQGTRMLSDPQYFTRRKLREIKTLVEQFHQKSGHWPASVADIDFDWGDIPRQKRQVFDSWHHPIIYQPHGSSYRLISYGADGKAGGTGLNCDLTSDNPNPPEAKMSRLEILRHPLMRVMEIVALICGGCVALITFFSIRDSQLKPNKWLGLAIQLIILVVTSAAVSTIITALHVPSGH